MSWRRNIEFALLIAFSLAFSWAPLVKTFRLAWTNEAYTHIVLIIPLSLALIYFDSKTARPVIEPGRHSGLVLLAVALAVACFARWGGALGPDMRLTLSMVATVLWWVASVLFSFGLPVFRAFLFPLCFLFWLVPFPDFLLNRIIETLQNDSAIATRWMFQLARVPVTQNGIMLSLPDLDIMVERECSSIRSSMVLIVTTMVLAHLFLRSWWRKLIVILIAIPLSVAKNALRIFVIVELALRVDPQYLTGDLHRRGGIVFLLIATIIVAGMLWLLRERQLPDRDATDPQSI